MGIHRASLMCLRAGYNNPVLSFLNDMQIQIRIFLPAGGKSSVSFRVGHGSVYGQILLLYIFHVITESLMVNGSILLINLKCGGVNGIESIHTHAALETCSCLLSQKPLHFHLVYQIFCTLMNVAESVNPLPGQI